MSAQGGETPGESRSDDGVVRMAGVEAWARPADGALRVTVRAGRAGPRDARTEAAVEARWADLVASNPRMFNGPLLSVAGADLASGAVECVRDDFKHLAVQDRVRTGVEILAVSGVLVARDRAGREHVMLGKRGVQTRVYGGLWELGPSGGMPLPREGVSELGLDDFVEHLREETREEAGIEIGGAFCTCAGFCRDFVARSLDVMVRVELRERVEEVASRARDWEYEDVRWVAVDEVEGLDRRLGAGIIAPTRAFFRVMGWAGDGETAER